MLLLKEGQPLRRVRQDFGVGDNRPVCLRYFALGHQFLEVIHSALVRISVRANNVGRQRGDNGPRLLGLSTRSLGKFGFGHAAGKVTHLERPCVREDEIDLGVQVGPTMLANVNEQNSRQEANPLP